MLLVLNTRGAVESLVASGGGMKLGGEMAVAAGPNGRGIGASLEPPRLASPDAGLGLAYDENGAMATPFEPPTDVEPIYSYSHAKGAFIGVSIEVRDRAKEERRSVARGRWCEHRSSPAFRGCEGARGARARVLTHECG